MLQHSNRGGRSGAAGRRGNTRLQDFLRPLLILSKWSTNWPERALTVLLAVVFSASLGLMWLETDDALESFLAADTPEYRTFEDMRKRFPASDLDVFIVAEADNIFNGRNLSALREVNFELLLSEDVSSIVSVFSLKEPLRQDRLPASIIPDEVPDDPGELARLSESVGTHPLASGRLLSKPDAAGQLALLVVALDRDRVRLRGLPDVISGLRAAVAEANPEPGLSIGIAGVPAMKAEVIEGTSRDIVIFNGAGLLVGAIICWLFFRRTRLVLIANAPAFVAIVCCLGLFGWTETRIDPLMNAVMPLVIVVTFNNAMHYLFAICGNLDAGLAPQLAIERATLEVAPACGLTSITTSIALLSLAFSSSPLISGFGAMAGACVLLALVLVLVTVPMMARTFLNNGQNYLTGKNPYDGVRLLDGLAVRLSRTVGGQPAVFVAIGVALTAIFFAAYTQLEPRYRLSDMLPDKGGAAAVTERMAERLSGVYPLNILIELPEGVSVGSDRARALLDEAHEIFSGQPEISKVSSLRDIQMWAESGGMTPGEASRRLSETIPPAIMARFYDPASNSLIVSGFIEDLQSKEILALSDRINADLDGLLERQPGFSASLTGLSSIAAQRSTEIISQLSRSMAGAILVVVLIIGLAFQSFATGGLSILPNLFALFATGTVLQLTYGCLDYATIVGLTVAFGLAVDDTIHVLNRHAIELRSGPIGQATHRTLRLIGTVLILTTIVLVAGLSVTQLSLVPPTRQFGMICILTLLFALFADLVFLPALILVTGRLRTVTIFRSLAGWFASAVRLHRRPPTKGEIDV